MHIDHLAHHPQHVPAIAQWQHTEFAYLNPAVTLAQRTDRLRTACLTGELPMALVALSDDGAPMGAASLLPKTITHAHLTPWLSTVVVPPEWRGRGIASALSLRVLAEARLLGFETLYLFTRHNERLYERLGWRTFDRVLHEGLPIVLMSRVVAAGDAQRAEVPAA